MRLENFFSRMIGGDHANNEKPPVEKEGRSLANDQQRELIPEIIAQCEQIIREDASSAYVAKIEMRHGISYLKELPSDAQQRIEECVRAHLQGKSVSPHSDERMLAVDRAFDELLPQWRTWLPEAWHQPPREER